LNIATKALTSLTDGYDNFPLCSPRGDLIASEHLQNSVVIPFELAGARHTARINQLRKSSRTPSQISSKPLKSFHRSGLPRSIPAGSLFGH
jgi:hypothetical protein